MSIKFNGDTTRGTYIQAGTKTVTAGVGSVASPYNSETIVTFDIPFPNTPKVVVSLASSETTAGYQLASINPAYDQFTIRFTNTSGSSAGCDVNWIAFYGPIGTI